MEDCRPRQSCLEPVPTEPWFGNGKAAWTGLFGIEATRDMAMSMTNS